MTLVAKTIVKDQLWVLVDGDRKVGNVEADESGYSVKIGEKLGHYADTKTIERDFQITFDRPKIVKRDVDLSYARWPVEGKTYNNFFDVKRRLHVFTKSAKSSCYHCAGYFRILMNDEWVTEFCPKYIFVQRYPYHGPFMTQEQAEQDK